MSLRNNLKNRGIVHGSTINILINLSVNTYPISFFISKF